MIPDPDRPLDMVAADQLIGAAMLHPDAAHVAADLDPCDWPTSRHAAIGSAIRQLLASGAERLDELLVADQLQRDGNDHDLEYLRDVTANTPSPSSARRYATIIGNAARNRRLIHHASALADAAADNDHQRISAAISAIAAEVAP
jgi:replicative DNA helicase